MKLKTNKKDDTFYLSIDKEITVLNFQKQLQELTVEQQNIICNNRSSYENKLCDDIIGLFRGIGRVNVNIYFEDGKTLKSVKFINEVCIELKNATIYEFCVEISKDEKISSCSISFIIANSIGGFIVKSNLFKIVIDIENETFINLLTYDSIMKVITIEIAMNKEYRKRYFLAELLNKNSDIYHVFKDALIFEKDGNDIIKQLNGIHDLETMKKYTTENKMLKLILNKLALSIYTFPTKENRYH